MVTAARHRSERGGVSGHKTAVQFAARPSQAVRAVLALNQGSAHLLRLLGENLARKIIEMRNVCGES